MTSANSLRLGSERGACWHRQTLPDLSEQSLTSSRNAVAMRRVVYTVEPVNETVHWIAAFRFSQSVQHQTFYEIKRLLRSNQHR